MTRRLYGATVKLSRFQKEKKRLAYKDEFESLQNKVFQAADSLGLDLLDDEVTDRLFEIACAEIDDDAKESMDQRMYAERFLALAYVQTIIIFDNTVDTEIIGALCLGNWLVGLVGGMPSWESTQYMCIPCIIKQHASRIGKAGAEKKAAPMRELEQWALMQYQAGEWPSANKAAHDLTPKVLKHGRHIGAILSEQNAQRTIAEWIRKARKMLA